MEEVRAFALRETNQISAVRENLAHYNPLPSSPTINIFGNISLQVMRTWLYILKVDMYTIYLRECLIHK